MIFATKDGAVFKGNMHEDDYVYLLTSPLCPQWGPPNCTRQGNSPPTSIARRPRSPEVQTTWQLPKMTTSKQVFFVKYALFFFKFSFLYRQLCNQKRPWLWNPLQLVPHGYWTHFQLSTGPFFVAIHVALICSPLLLGGGVGWGGGPMLAGWWRQWVTKMRATQFRGKGASTEAALTL